MAILTVCVNKQRKERTGATRFISGSLTMANRYIYRLDKVVSGKGLSSSMEVIDPFVLKPLSTQIVNWLDALNRQDISAWNAETSCRVSEEFERGFGILGLCPKAH